MSCSLLSSTSEDGSPCGNCAPLYFPTGALPVYSQGWHRSGLAIASPLDAFASFLLTSHMVQHMLIMLVAPPLILLASPLNPVLRGLPLWATRDALGPFLNWPLLKRFGRALTHPAVCWLAAVVVLLAWHIPAAYDLALASRGWHGVEHASLFGTSLLFWWPIIQPWPSTPRWPRWSIPAYLLAGDIVTTALAAILCFSDRPLYPAYAAAPRLFGWSQLNDQVAAGALMWVFGSFILLSAAVVVTLQLLDPSPVDPKQRNEPNSCSRLARPSRPALICCACPRRCPASRPLRTPGVASDSPADCRCCDRRRLHRPPHGSNEFGRRGPVDVRPCAGRRSATPAGNFFCMACPFTLPREAGQAPWDCRKN